MSALTRSRRTHTVSTPGAAMVTLVDTPGRLTNVASVSSRPVSVTLPVAVMASSYQYDWSPQRARSVPIVESNMSTQRTRKLSMGKTS